MAGLLLPAAPLLADEVVYVRPWRESDVSAEIFVEQKQARPQGEELSFALVEPSDHEKVLGGGSLHGIDLEQGRASVGYWLEPHARGRGIVTHAVRLVARWAFEELGIARLELTCGPDNQASQRVAERCGFSREGVLRSHRSFKGRRRDTVIFSLLPGELR